MVVNTGTGDGTLQLNLKGNGTITDLSGNPLTLGTGTFTGPTYTIDKTPPTVQSIVLGNGVGTVANPTNAASVTFTVTFTELVTGVAVADFVATEGTGLTGASVAGVVPVAGSNGTAYIVTVNSGTGTGTLRLDVIDQNNSIVDAAGNPLGANFTTGPSYQINTVPPTVLSDVATDPSPTSAVTVHYTVTFSETVTGVAAGDFALTAGTPGSPTGMSVTGVAAVAGSNGTAYVVTVKTGAGDGTLRLDVINNGSIVDAAGNLLTANYTSGQLYTIDRTHPTSIILSNASVVEHARLNTVVGSLSSVGPHSGAYTYALVSGTGSGDNASFRIVGNLLQTSDPNINLTKGTYSIRIQTTDSLGYTLQEPFTITVVAAASTVSLGGFAWNDLNGDGIDESEPDMAGVAVDLFCSPAGVVGDVNDYSLGQAVTNSLGVYQFNQVLPGLNYYLVFHAPSGYTFSPQNVNSAANALGVTTLISNLAASNTDLNAGLVTAAGAHYNFAIAAGASGNDAGQAIATDAAGNVYVTGTFQGTVDFDPGPGVYNLTSAAGGSAFVAEYTSSGALLWADSMGGTGDVSGNGIALGPDGSVYVTGNFSGTANFLSGPGSYNLTAQGSPGVSTQDVFVAKLDSSGRLVWADDMGGTGDDVANAIAVGSDGSVYTTGYFEGTANFNPGASVYNLTAIGPKDIFISKLDSNGNFVWADRMGGTGWAQGMSIGTGIALAADGSVYTTGSFQGTADFDPTASQTTLTCNGQTNAYVMKLTSAGSFVWVRGMGGPTTAAGAGIAVASDDGSVVVTGSFQGTATFGTLPNLSSAGYQRLFAAKLSPAGNFLWADAFGGTGYDRAGGIAIGANDSVYVDGGFWGTADFDPGTGTYPLTSLGNKDVFLLTLNSSGGFLSAQRVGGSGDDYAAAVAVSATGAAYTTGYFQGTVNFDPSTAVYNLTAAGGEDLFVAKFTPAAAPLTVTINQAANQADPTTASPIHFTVVFSGAVTNFTTGDVTLGGTAGATTAIVSNPSGDQITYDVAVSGMTGSGTVTASIAAGVAQNAAGTLNQASTSTDNSVTFSVVPATFTLTGPTSGTYTVGQSVPINWTTGNAAAGSSVALCYDTGTSFSNVTWITYAASGANGNGTYSWNTTGVAPGTYYVGGYLWSNGKATYSHLTKSITIQAAVVAAPTFKLTGPTSGTYTVGQSVPINWTTGNAAAGSSVALCYGTGTSFTNVTWITYGASGANGNGAYSWNTAGVTPGTYYVGGYLWSGGKATYSHLTQSITIKAAPAPTFTLTAPTSGTVTAGTPVTIKWTTANAAAGSTVALCYGTGTSFSNVTWITYSASGANGNGTYSWNTTNVPGGTYYIGGYLWSGGKPYYSHLTQSITIAEPLTLATPAFAPPAQPLPADEVLDSQQELTPIVNAAIQRLAWVTGSQVLASVSVQIADLPGNLLGEEIGKTILIDRDAAGYGWFIDPTPQDDAEFTQLAADVLVARPGTAAQGHADLLTAVMHEMAHVLGYEHDSGEDLMSPTLPLGQRRFLAGSPAYFTALAANYGWNQPVVGTGLLDQVFASSDQDGNNEWSWL